MQAGSANKEEKTTMKSDNRSIKQRLLEIGERQYRAGRIGITVFFCELGLTLFFFLMQFAFQGGAWTFALAMTFSYPESEYQFIQHFTAAIIYLGSIFSAITVPLFFSGLHYLGLAQIASNTEVAENQPQKDRSAVEAKKVTLVALRESGALSEDEYKAAINQLLNEETNR